jgi:hypothetical protein
MNIHEYLFCKGRVSIALRRYLAYGVTRFFAGNNFARNVIRNHLLIPMFMHFINDHQLHSAYCRIHTKATAGTTSQVVKFTGDLTAISPICRPLVKRHMNAVLGCVNEQNWNLTQYSLSIIKYLQKANTLYATLWVSPVTHHSYSGICESLRNRLRRHFLGSLPSSASHFFVLSSRQSQCDRSLFNTSCVTTN